MPEARQRLIAERLLGRRIAATRTDSIAATPHHGIAPTSFAQERFWFLHQLRPGAPLYNLPLALRLRGPLDHTALKRSLHALALRHDVLRTTYIAPEGRPLQRIAAGTAPVSLPPVPLAEAALTDAVFRHMAQPFDLGRGPLLRPALFRIAPDDHVIALAVQHSIGDLVTIGLLAKELSEGYLAALAGRAPDLPVLPIQYADYAVWQRQAAASEEMAARVATWRARLADLVPLRLPTDRPSASLQARQSAFFDLGLATGPLPGLRDLMRDEDATLYMVGLAALNALLWWRTGRSAFAVGTPAAGRTRPELENLLGCFINMMTLRADVRPAQTFRELLGQSRKRVLEALADQDIPFERLVAEVSPDRSTTDNPFTTVGYGAGLAEAGQWQMGPLQVESFLPPPQGIATFDLVVVLAQDGERLTSRWIYAPELFDEQTVRRMAGDYRRILLTAVRDPRTTVSELCRLDRAQHRAVVLDRNDTAGPFPDLRIDQLFEAVAARQPRAPALRQSGTVMTYGELDAAANRLAHLLRAEGAGTETPVGIYLDRSPDLIVAMLAVLKAGAAYVPLDRGQPAARIRLMLDSSGADLVVSRSGLAGEFGGAGLRMLLLDALAGRLAALPVTAPPKTGPTNALAYVIYTSGSTGVPKGVAVEHRSVANVIDWVNATFGVGRDDRLLFVTQAGFDLSVYDVFGVLAAGGCVVLPADAELSEADRLLDLLSRERITLWDSAPAALLPIMAVGEAAPAFPPNSLRLVLVSGDWVPLTLPGRARRAFPGARFVALGGATEATIWSNWFEVGSVAAGWVSVPYGWPIRNARYYVLDDRLEPVPVRVPGELFIGGSVLARGYHGQPALTAGRFLPDPFGSRGARMYRTGDRVRLFPDGVMEFLGRVDGQVKIRGFRVETAEVEAVLAGHPGVRDCAVVPRELANGETALVGYVVARDGLGEPDEIRAHLARNLPGYMIPARFVTIDALPLSANGKCDRDSLPAPAEQRDRPAAEPRTPTERALAEIWAELLGLRHIGRDDNFFELGGHSLLGLRLVLMARRRFAVDLLVGELIANPTMRQFAQAIDQAAAQPGRSESPLLCLAEDGAGVPVVLVHPVGGGIGCYAALLPLLTDRPVYAFEARRAAENGLIGMAAEYLTELRASGPRAPYVLCGWSMGGAVALEMAQQLVASGAPAPPVVMIDPTVAAPGHAPDGPMPRFSDAQMVRAFGNEIAATLGAPGLAATDGGPGAPELTLAELAREFARAGLDLGLSEAELRHRYDIFRGNTLALARYNARLASHAAEDLNWSESYTGDVLLIVAVEDTSIVDTWQAVCASLTVRALAGGHYGLLTGQNAEHIATAMVDAAQGLTATGPGPA